MQPQTPERPPERSRRPRTCPTGRFRCRRAERRTVRIPRLEELVDLSWLAMGDAPPPQPVAAGADRASGQAAGPSAGPPQSADEPAAVEYERGPRHKR